MLVDLIYGVPTWEMAIGVVLIAVTISLLGLFFCSRFVPLRVRRKHNEFVGFNVGLIGMVFAVLLAFIAVDAWGSFDKADNAADLEASLAGDLFRDALEIPEPVRTELISDVRYYVEIVMDKEWPAMARGTEFGDEGWVPLIEFNHSLANIQTADPIKVVMVSETLKHLNSLYDARRSRLLVAHAHIDPTIWWVLVLGAGLTIAFTSLFGMDSFAMHVSMTVGAAVSLAMVIVLIVALDYPFRGEMQVTAHGFAAVRYQMERAGIMFAHAGS